MKSSITGILLLCSLLCLGQIRFSGDTTRVIFHGETTGIPLEFEIPEFLSASGFFVRVYGDSVNHTKQDFTDASEQNGQDVITNDVVLARAALKGIFNIAQESEYVNSSPLGTSWSRSPTIRATTSSYTNWKEAMNDRPPSQVGKAKGLTLTGKNRCFDVILKSWGQQGAGGFSHTRIETPCWLKQGDTQSKSQLIRINGDALIREKSWWFIMGDVALHSSAGITFEKGEEHLLRFLDDLNLTTGFAEVTFSLGGLFSDRPTELFASVSDTGVIALQVEGDSLRIEEVGLGEAVVSVGGQIQNGQWVFETFSIEVGTISGIGSAEIDHQESCEPSKWKNQEIVNTVELISPEGIPVWSGAPDELQLQHFIPGVYILKYYQEYQPRYCRILME